MRRLFTRVMAARARVTTLALALASGCGPEEAPMDGGETGPDEPTPPPSFIDLDSSELEISAARVEPLTLAVADLRPSTRVEIDGLSWQPGPASPAQLEDELLRFPFGGAMVEGVHQLQLVHVVEGEELRSEAVTISVVESAPGELSANLGLAPSGLGDRLVAHGQGPEAIFALVDDVAELATIRAGSWHGEGFELALPGLDPGAGGLDLSVVHVEGQRWVVVAWLAEGGQLVRGRVQLVDGPGAPIEDPGEVLTLWELGEAELDALFGPHEFAQIEAVRLLGRTLVLGVHAPRDVEQATIGDHFLATRWIAASGEPLAPVILRGVNGVDLDLPGDARVWTYAGYEALASVRVGLAFPWLLAVAANGLPQLVEDPGELLSVASGASWMVSADGALGSRHVFALEGGVEAPRARALRINRWSEDAEDPDERSDVLALPAWPSASPSLGLLDGTPTLVMPMGPDADALALRSTGAASELVEIPDLRCDELALANAGVEGVADTLPMACLDGGELWMGFLSID